MRDTILVEEKDGTTSKFVRVKTPKPKQKPNPKSKPDSKPNPKPKSKRPLNLRQQNRAVPELTRKQNTSEDLVRPRVIIHNMTKKEIAEKIAEVKGRSKKLADLSTKTSLVGSQQPKLSWIQNGNGFKIDFGHSSILIDPMVFRFRSLDLLAANTPVENSNACGFIKPIVLTVSPLLIFTHNHTHIYKPQRNIYS